MNKRKGFLLRALLAGVCLLTAALLIYAFTTGFNLSIAPLSTTTTFESPAQAVMSGERIYVLDQYSMRVSCVEDGLVRWFLLGGGEEEGQFYKAQAIAVDELHNLYVHNIVYDEQGVLITREEVLVYDADGKYLRTAYGMGYAAGTQPANNGNFSGIKAWGDTLFIAERRDAGVVLVQVDRQGNVSLTAMPVEGLSGRAMYLAVAPDGTLFYTDKIGSLRRLTESGVEDAFVPDKPPEGELGVIPYGLDMAEDGSVIFTDIGRRQILRLAPGAASPEVVVRNAGDTPEALMETPLRYPVSVSGDVIVTTDAESVELFDLATGEATSAFAAATLPVRDRVTQAAGWIGLAVAAVVLLGLAAYMVYRIIKNPNSVVGRIGLAVVVIVILTSLLVGYITLTDAGNNTSAEFERQIEYIARLIDEHVDGDLLKTIDASEDIDSEEYRAFKEQMDTFINTAYDTDYGLYYLVYRRLGGVPCVVADAENNLPAVYPQVVGELFDVGYAGEYGVDSNYADAYGVWAFAVGPIHDSAGEVVGIVEVGVNMYSMTALRQEQTIELILNMATLLVLLIFFLGEALVFYGYWRKRKESLAGEGLETILRPIIFLLFAAQCMQDSFIPVLAIRLYQPVFGLPETVGGALPITVEMLMLAIFSIVGGSILSRAKIKPMLIASLITAFAGFLISALAPGFYILMLGKAIIGAGVGLTYVTLNTAVAAIPDPERSEAMFGELNAGMISGIQFGLGVGAYLYGAFSYFGAYMASAGMIVLALFITAVLVGKTQFGATRREEARGGMSTLRFIFKRRTLGFFLFSIIPALVAVSFFEYYFPIFGDANALSETRIGQILLLNGIMAIYTGPAVTRWLLHRIGAKPAVFLVSVLFAAGLLAFALSPSVLTMVLLSLFFGLITGFSYSVQSTYFSRVDGFAQYGEGRAMGLYAMFQSIAQSFAPLLIGSLFLSGMTRGTLILAIGVGASGLLFLLVSAGRIVAGQNTGITKEG